MRAQIAAATAAASASMDRNRPLPRGPPVGSRFGGPLTGATLTGMVKSYNRKGFGFIMCQKTADQDNAHLQDIYFSRESVHPQLQTSDLAGESVTFEVHRFPDGKLQARNLRPVGDVTHLQGANKERDRGKGSKGINPFVGKSTFGGKDGEEDRSRDWWCENCSERNFVKRFECFKCKALRPRTSIDGGLYQASIGIEIPRRTLSPHAGSRAMREMLKGNLGVPPCVSSRSGRVSRSRSRRRRRRNSSSSDDRSRRGSSRRKKSRRKRRRSSRTQSRSGSRDRRRKNNKKNDSGSAESSASSSDSDSGSDASGPGGAGGADTTASSTGAATAAALRESAAAACPEVEKAKAEALTKLMQLRDVEPKEARMKEFRALLRQWHPDKNPGRVEVATAVFQFLQKGKLLMEADAAAST